MAKKAKKSSSEKIKEMLDLTNIHWSRWLTSDDELDEDDLFSLVRRVKEYPQADLVYGEDSDGDTYLVLASGDLSKGSITKALDERLR